MKRKANMLDERFSGDSCSPSSDSSAPSYKSLNQKAVGSVPWTFAPRRSHVNDHINFRTRKRVRDNRPDLDAIHQNTLAKLFNAQRQTEMHSPVTHTTAIGNVNEHDNGPSTLEVIEPAQRSLHSFFGTGQQPGSAKQATLSLQQPPNMTSHSCEDCGDSLYQSVNHQIRDLQMMEVDQLQEPFMDEDYECAVCSRNVCDMCAVRGDRRICLECMMPGSG